MKKRIGALLATLVVILGLNVVTATPAHASAYGCDSWAAFSVGSLPVPVPRGFLCHGITGSGTSVTNETVHWETVPGLCNNRVVLRYRDLNQVWYKSVDLGTKYNCNWSYDATWTPNWTARRGIACAYLYTNGVYVTSQCHSIS